MEIQRMFVNSGDVSRIMAAGDVSMTHTEGFRSLGLNDITI
jgi:hypothetical protein